jgi:hypothetical protein
MRCGSLLLHIHSLHLNVATRTVSGESSWTRVPTRRLTFSPGVDVGHEPYSDKNSKMLILDLLCSCIRVHSYRFKYFAIRNNLCVKVRV